MSRIVTADGDLERAGTGQSITLTLDREIDVSRGDVLSATTHKLFPRRSLTGRVLWMVDEKLTVGREYILQLSSASANVRITTIHHLIDIESFARRPSSEIAMNQIGLVSLECDKPVIAANYRNNSDLGAFILIDRMTNQTAGLGVVELGEATSPAIATPANATLFSQIAGEAGSEARRRFVLRSSLEAAAALTLAGIVWLLTENPIAAAATLVFEAVARTAIQVILARGEPDKTLLDEAQEGGGGI